MTEEINKEVVETVEESQQQAVEESKKTGRCGSSCFRFEDLDMAKGYNLLGIGRGGVVMSNIFLSTSLIYLASQQAGCLILDENDNTIVDKDCETKVYGMLPISLISNIAVISGLLSAFCMPIVGAIVDFTPHRTLLGVTFATLIGVIQAVQIGTVSSTWFAMALLQALAGFFYQAHIMSVYSFLPTIARKVSEQIMVAFTATWTMTQFSGQASFLLVIIVLSIVLKTNDVVTAQMSQGVNVAWILVFFTLGWRLFPWKIPANRVLPEGHSLVTEGFRQNWRTIQNLYRGSKALRYYFLTVVFAEAGTNTFTTVAPSYLVENLGMNGTQVGIFFFITLIGSLPGSQLGLFVTRRTNPNTSWILCMISLATVANLGAFILDAIQKQWASYIWGACMGLMLGWFYPTENCFFSMIVPASQESELSGFFVYSTQIIGWLPPLCFSLMVEHGLNQKWGVLVISGFLLVAIGVCMLQAPWPELVKEKDCDALIKGEAVKGELDDDNKEEDDEENC
mmetsp:Transcript_23871/g.36100  ORF Transcript_23871/g.36100 Transcript_23871/m.36100 type:complete len:510 (+) Transcript_23871:140-1669(+)|eukprot:CAMPEP_0194208810 /NCGR_PEP_ID=MMETSP0156-20130528/7146_1 /TAXON_ID=33649 /ORGANISM="Thalassionema nitzschioides, Strain L26-B" /LENGTH=509 /DNA_ID=CAMNT_0038935851 /DNA_START=132 /DNA_END=1661 /DNA_ORIENTATION=-